MPYKFLATVVAIFHAIAGMSSEDDEQVHYLPHHETVKMGTLVTDLRNFDYSKNSFDIIFYVWWESKDRKYRPDKIIEITNAFAFDHKDNFQTSFKKGFYNTSVRYYATVHYDWDMTHFPFDRQILQVKMEDGLSDIDSVKFVPDIKNSKLANELNVRGWTIEGFSITEKPFVYRTNFGNDEVEHSIFSRMFLEFDLKRSGLREFINYFVAFFIGVFLIALGYFIDPSFTDAKFSLALSAIFAVMANKYILDSLLPGTPSFTLSDNIQLLSFSYIIIGSAIFTLESILMQKNHTKLCIKVNYISCIITTIAYLWYLGYVVHAAVSS
jgi:hypothetical protein